MLILDLILGGLTARSVALRVESTQLYSYEGKGRLEGAVKASPRDPGPGTICCIAPRKQSTNVIRGVVTYPIIWYRVA